MTKTATVHLEKNGRYTWKWSLVDAAGNPLGDRWSGIAPDRRRAARQGKAELDHWETLQCPKKMAAAEDRMLAAYVAEGLGEW